ncbi:cupin domain-containing protein [Aestuariivirga sp.]|jgi:quercetin dioxygenase-like cupin family protein|uniref:cupin domain-containing protein n=1 Tax=Aestuariivirga sp. TaxID=2650926 RepID=UPI003783D085
MMHLRLPTAAFFAIGLMSAPALADGYPATPLLSTAKTIVGEDIVYPASGQPQVNAMMVNIAPGEKTELHSHGVPLFVYVLEGEVTVEYTGHGQKTFKQGDSFVEAMNVTHRGMNLTDGPVRILAVYMSAVGAKDVIPAQ